MKSAKIRSSQYQLKSTQINSNILRSTRIYSNLLKSTHSQTWSLWRFCSIVFFIFFMCFSRIFKRLHVCFLLFSTCSCVHCFQVDQVKSSHAFSKGDGGYDSGWLGTRKGNSAFNGIHSSVAFSERRLAVPMDSSRCVDSLPHGWFGCSDGWSNKKGI